MLQPLLRTVAETAELLGLSERSVWDLIRSETIASIEVPSARGTGQRASRRVEQAEIESFIARHRTGTPAAASA